MTTFTIRAKLMGALLTWQAMACGSAANHSDESSDGSMELPRQGSGSYEVKGILKQDLALSSSSLFDRAGEWEEEGQVSQSQSDSKGQVPTPASPIETESQQSVLSGDSKPVDLPIHSAEACTELLQPRCASCCEDFFSIGSEGWERCVESCPESDFDLMKNEY